MKTRVTFLGVDMDVECTIEPEDRSVGFPGGVYIEDIFICDQSIYDLIENYVEQIEELILLDDDL